MCTAMYQNNTLARTVDRQGSIEEHRVIGKKRSVGGVILAEGFAESGEIWIDGMNAGGLMMAMLNYRRELTDESARPAENTKIHPGALIPAVLDVCDNTADAADFLASVTLTDEAPAMFPHYILADTAGNCIIFENGKAIANPLGVLANAPSFDEQMRLLPDLTAELPEIVWNVSSESRFQRAAWLKTHARLQTAADFMHLLDSVSVPDGADPRKGYRTLVKTVMSPADGMYIFSTESHREPQSIRIGQTGEFRLI